MWTPRSFRESDPERLWALVEAHPFAIVVGPGPDGLMATHLPLFVEGDQGPNGTLIGHLARANPHWKAWADGPELLVIFRGPHAYISPNWYENQVTVPTWNYAAVHVYGRPRLVHDRAELLKMTSRLTRIHEDSVPGEWTLDHARDVLGPELKAIVGFEIPVDRVIGKFKLNQNRSREDRVGVAAALAESQRSEDRGVAGLMEQQLSAESDPA